MGYRSLQLYNFRNLHNAVLDIDVESVVFVGNNGQGKTNLLEAIYYLSYGASFRTRSEEQIVRHGENEMSVRGVAAISPDQVSDIECRWSAGKKAIYVDSKRITDRRDMIWIMPCIYFSYDDFIYSAGSAQMVRYFFDQTISLFDPLYVNICRRYRQTLKQRNAALRLGQENLLDVHDLQLAQSGLEIVQHRRDVTKIFQSIFSGIYRSISCSDRNLEIDYQPSWKEQHTVEEVCHSLTRRRQRDLATGITSVGPHRDRFIFSEMGRDFSTVASTGQVRLTSLVLRITQATLFRQRTGRKPLLLIDDVLLELDPTHRERVFHHFPECEQAYFTFLPDESFTRYRQENTMVYTVEDGRVTQSKIN